jgi:hypothetical protein
MSGWTEIEVGKVKMIHHSTSSLVQIIVTDIEEYQPGHYREETNELWIDYYQFEDLKKAINKTEH